MQLQRVFEIKPPKSERGDDIPEDVVISLFPNGPIHYHNNFYEKNACQSILLVFKHAEEVKIEVPLDALVVPAI
jgi:hypothetical protein